LDIHETISTLAGTVRNLSPQLVFFFATGGIPIVFPLMRRLADLDAGDLIDGHVFHMFPGLAWDGNIDGQRPNDYFRNEVAPLLRETVRQGLRPKIVSIDTTYSGNAVNLAVHAIVDACASAGVSGADVHVMGVVNASRAAHRREANRVPLLLRDGSDIFVLPPGGYTPTGPLGPGSFVRFTSAGSALGHLVDLKIGYWVVPDLFTEDNAELLGIAAVHSHLGVDTTGTPGRMEISFTNGRISVETGLSAVGSRLLQLLGADRTSTAWQVLEQTHNLGFETEEERDFRETTALDHDGLLSIFEMDHCPEATLEYLLSEKAPLRPVQINWLAQHDPFPAALTPRVVAALRQAVVGSRDEDNQTVLEAAQFLRRAYPEDVLSEPPGSHCAELQAWWLSIATKHSRS
jgi:hypothetical protein